MKLYKLDTAIRAACPIDGVNSAGVISFAATATEKQKVAAQAIADAWLNDPSIEDNDEIEEQILAIEATITQRRNREAILGTDNGWLADTDAKIKALRAQLK